jgi:hypothetical protein
MTRTLLVRNKQPQHSLPRHLERRRVVSGRERCPGCHPERLAVILSASAEALSEAKGKDLCARRASPFAEFPLSEAKGLRACP